MTAAAKTDADPKVESTTPRSEGTPAPDTHECSVCHHRVLTGEPCTWCGHVPKKDEE